MIQTIKRSLFFAALLLVVCCQSGYASGAHRFYSGSPLPKNEIALVYAVKGCHIRDVRDEREKETKYLDVLRDAASGLLDLLPGQYIVGITYKSSKSTFENTTSALGDKVRLEFNAEAGNIYVVYPAIDGVKWKPVIVNIKGYDMTQCNRSNKYEDCPSIEVIDKKITAYLQSDRPILRFHPLSETPYYKPVTEEAKRDIKGFWW